MGLEQNKKKNKMEKYDKKKMEINIKQRTISILFIVVL